MRRVISLVIALLCFTQPVSAQGVGVLTRTAILRDGPSKNAVRLESLDAGETVILLGQSDRSGYVQVRTQTEQVGWVWGRAVRLEDPTEVHAPASTHSFERAPTDVQVTSGDYDSCPDSGDAKVTSVSALNRLKNRSAEPQDADIDSSVTLAAMLAPSSNDADRFNEMKAAEITAYVYRVLPGGKSETTNCRLGDPVHRDTHIELTLSPTDTAEIRRVIVEVTPRWRAALHDRGIDWSTATLQQTIEGQWVKVRGGLMFDAEHKAQAENTHPGGSGNWRATAWEIHPVAAITVVSQP